jgi:hypothetical protein
MDLETSGLFPGLPISEPQQSAPRANCRRTRTVATRSAGAMHHHRAPEVRRASGLRNDYVRARFCCQPHQGHQRLGSTRHDLHGLYRDALHFRDRLTQTVGAGWTTVHQVVVQKAVVRLVVGEGEDVANRPLLVGLLWEKSTPHELGR